MIGWAGHRSLVATTSLLALLAFGAPASADDKQACVAASEKAQQLKNAGKLSEAREQLNACSRAECPKLIQQDCTQWMSELLAALPSVVPGAKDRKGRDIVDVRVSVDGKVVAHSLDGKAIVLDPGVHTFHFEASGAPTIDEQVVVKPGEKNRLVTVTFAKGEDAAGPASGHTGHSGAGTGAPPEEPPRSSPPVAAYIVGGVGLVTLGVAGVFLLGANSDARGLRDSCAPRCSQTEVDDIQDKYNLAGITAGIGGALLVTGVVLFIVHSSSRSSRSVGQASVPALVGSGGVIRF
jgi:hypothetical protein